VSNRCAAFCAASETSPDLLTARSQRNHSGMLGHVVSLNGTPYQLRGNVLLLVLGSHLEGIEFHIVGLSF
jgi:hypothetical protein